MIRITFLIATALVMMSGCSTQDTEREADATTLTDEVTIGKIQWSDGDSGRLDGVPFRLRDIDAPETGGVGAAIGGAECEQERQLGIQARAFIESLTQFAAIRITANYGPDRFDRHVVDLDADGIDVATAGLEAGILKPWPHDANGNALASKPDWCN